jgi:hypothetical protein
MTILQDHYPFPENELDEETAISTLEDNVDEDPQNSTIVAIIADGYGDLPREPNVGKHPSAISPTPHPIASPKGSLKDSSTSVTMSISDQRSTAFYNVSDLQMRLSSSPSETKYIPIALSLSDRLFEAEILVKDSRYWDDRMVMQELQNVYWEARGKWKKWWYVRRLWPWHVLAKIGPAKVFLGVIYLI